MNDGVPYMAYLPVMNQHSDLRKLRMEFVDNYASFYKHLGIFRDEMPNVMSALALVDVLSGKDILEYEEEKKR